MFVDMIIITAPISFTFRACIVSRVAFAVDGVFAWADPYAVSFVLNTPGVIVAATTPSYQNYEWSGCKQVVNFTGAGPRVVWFTARPGYALWLRYRAGRLGL